MNNKIPQQGESIPRQGEIWLADFNRKKTNEQSKIRPVLILNNNWQNQTSRYVVVAPLTSDEEKLKYVASFEVLIEAEPKNGLDTKSKILLHRLLAVEKNLRLIERKGKVEEKIWTQVWKALWVVFTGKKANDKQVFEVN